MQCFKKLSICTLLLIVTACRADFAALKDKIFGGSKDQTIYIKNNTNESVWGAIYPVDFSGKVRNSTGKGVTQMAANNELKAKSCRAIKFKYQAGVRLIFAKRPTGDVSLAEVKARSQDKTGKDAIANKVANQEDADKYVTSFKIQRAKSKGDLYYTISENSKKLLQIKKTAKFDCNASVYDAGDLMAE
jgi:hypothetical protein